MGIPKVTLFDSYPFTALRAELIRLSAGAERCEAAVAFITRSGCDLVRSVCDANQLEFDIVASVRFPTNLSELTRLSSRADTEVFIHTGYKFPEEPQADRGQFHSKIAIFSFKSGKRILVIGSHNWTGNALDGNNLEASVIIECDRNDAIALHAELHFLECKARSQRLDPGRLQFYQAIQKRLHCSPGPLPTDPLPGFQKLEAVVIHAELTANTAIKSGNRLYLPIDQVASDFFPDGQRVRLIVHPLGSLFQKSVVSSSRQILDGVVTMANTVSDDPVLNRSVDAEIKDLARPVITPLAGNVPPISGEAKQVIVRFETERTEELAVFHSAASGPRLSVGEIQWLDVNRDELTSDEFLRQLEQLRRYRSELVESGSTAGKTLKNEQEVTVPQELNVVAEIKLAARWMYPEELETQFRSLIYSRDLVAIEDSPEIRFLSPSTKEMIGDYVYRVYFECSHETITDAATQQKLNFE